MKKEAEFKWDKAYHNAFNSIKKYLLNPPILSLLILGKPLILYIKALSDSLGTLLAQQNKEEKEAVLYYLSQP